MKSLMFALAVSTGLLAVPLSAHSENAVRESQAARDALWERAEPKAEREVIRNWFRSDKVMSRAARSEGENAAHIAGRVNAWADNYAAGRVHGPAGR